LLSTMQSEQRSAKRRPASYESLLRSPDDYRLHFTCGDVNFPK
jgi:hypothetical protein